MKKTILILVLVASWIAATQPVTAEDPMILTFLNFDNSATTVDDAILSEVRGGTFSQTCNCTWSWSTTLTCDQTRALLGYLLYLSSTYEAPACPTCTAAPSCPSCTQFPSGLQDGHYYIFTYTPGSGFSYAPNTSYSCSSGVCM